MTKVKVVNLLDKATSSQNGTPYDGPWNEMRRAKVHGIVEGGAGTLGATIVVKGSNDGKNYKTLGTITLSGVSGTNDTVDVDYPWAFVTADATAVSGTNAVASAYMSI